MRNMNSIIRKTISTKNQLWLQLKRQYQLSFENQCLTPNIVYQTDVFDNLDNEKRVYLGVSETPFKERYGNHIRIANMKDIAMQLNCQNLYGN